MKTFFLALILGIFIGSIVTNYFADPQAYEHLKEAKAQLFQQEDSDPNTPSEPEEIVASEPAQFEVGSGSLETSEAPEEPAAQPLPLPKAPAASTEASPEVSSAEAPASEVEEAEPDTTPAAEAPAAEAHSEDPVVPLAEPTQPAEATQAEQAASLAPKSRTEELIEQGSQKAEEIVEKVSEKAKEVAEEAKPFIEEGIDLTIAAGIRAQYKLERRINSDTIKISVKDNIVTLSGTVDSEETKQLAIEIAVFTKGVNGVEETLSIAP